MTVQATIFDLIEKRKLPDTSLSAYREMDLADLDGEIWMPIRGYENLYQVSTHGRIKTLAKCGHWVTKIKKQRINKFGYPTVVIWKAQKIKHFFVHILVATHFISERKKGKQVNHKDGIKTNNHFKNLEWCTPSENLRHAFKNGLMSQKGERHASNKLNNEQVIEIFNSKASLNDLAEKYGVCFQNISLIRTGKAWKHITASL